MKNKIFPVLISMLILNPLAAQGQETQTPASEESTQISHIVFDDKGMLNGFAKEYENLSKEIILEMIKDETLMVYQAAAAVRIFKTKYANETVSREKRILEKILLRKLNRTDSPFVEIETISSLIYMDRYRFFNSMVPILLQKLNHYNETVNELAFENLENIVALGNNRPREARIIFNTLRRMLFLSRKRLETIKEPSPKLTRKLKLLRWSIKVLGTEELKNLPKEVINLL